MAEPRQETKPEGHSKVQNEEQTEAPPSYAMATGSSTTSQPTKSSFLGVPGEHNGIPSSARKSMEDEQRRLPDGWVRQWDAKEKHQFFVDTKANPPRSIWVHPYDDEQYLSTLTSEERERIQESDEHRDEKKPLDSHDQGANHSVSFAPLPDRTDNKAPQKSSFGRKMKDKLTGMTHEEREQDRLQRAEEERQYYEAHMRFRQALHQAQMTGQPQFLAKDRDGRDVWVEPPAPYGGRGYANGGYGYNPYGPGSPYSNPNNRFIRPTTAYARPGGGYGMPIAGGLLGGMLLGGLLF